MLDELLRRLAGELHLTLPPPPPRDHPVTLKLTSDVEIDIKELKPGVFFHTNIAACPDQKREEVFMHLMNANLLGQGTQGSCLGLSRDEKFLTLSLGLPYELNYQEFKQELETFVNILDYWRHELENPQ